MGYGIANSWRISGDGHDWGALALAINRMAALTRWNGPGGWNGIAHSPGSIQALIHVSDPDLLIADNEVIGGLNQQQSRTQFTLWCVFPAPLLISYDLTNVSEYQLEASPL